MRPRQRARLSRSRAYLLGEHALVPSIAIIILGNSTIMRLAPHALRVVWIFDINLATNTNTFNRLPQLLLQGGLPNPLPSSGV